ncbi:MAG: helix-turn-helix transcriptional regulator [Clostridiales bacterium]|nr:helix-turn-helix transcriptional regulator [Clostridiales bacterium]
MFGIGNSDFVSPGSIGAKIKKIREYRGLTQKQLGLRCGFSEATADVRIGQYEKNKKTPREKALKTLCEALEIDESALFDADLLIENLAKHALFDIEDFHGLRPVKIQDKYYLEFSGTTVLNQRIEPYSQSDFLKVWLENFEKYCPSDNDSEEVKKQKKMEYDLWRYEYPLNEADKFSKKIRLHQEKEKLEQKLKDINELLESQND